LEGRQPVLFNIFIVYILGASGPFEARCLRKHVKENTDVVFTDTLADPNATEYKRPLAPLKRTSTVKEKSQNI
jgi:hypothetical protein